MIFPVCNAQSVHASSAEFSIINELLAHNMGARAPSRKFKRTRGSDDPNRFCCCVGLVLSCLLYSMNEMVQYYIKKKEESSVCVAMHG